jgi:hypothetical protein
VIAMLAEAGVFALGGVMVGTQALVVLGNSLGVSVRAPNTRIEELEIALPVKLPELAPLARLERGFSLACGLSPRRSSTSFKVHGKGVRVELLVPGHDHESAAQAVPAFAALARPTPYLGLLLDKAEPAAVIGSRGAILVNTPEPARFALHRLLLPRSDDDVREAGALLELLAQQRPRDLRAARDALESHGAAARKLLRDGLRKLGASEPKLGRQLRSLLGQ